ncbi:hypothetical protein [Rhizosphaericola mali]|uniref:Uncharacterized protein n=1 Tax=Rhizosphaericola mali TaxID=2545455 RepID=A0A5P2G2T8_9BACT|nr:hypothetical protein [Rhizosphaericola mali]QES87423.1 hypothetical protein E0W69_001675 [Rhizosphaericola mali]
MSQEKSSQNETIIVPSSPITVISDPNKISTSTIIETAPRKNVENTIINNSNTVVLFDMVVLKNDPKPLPIFKINFVNDSWKQSRFYTNRYGVEFFNIPDDLFIYVGNVDTANVGKYTVKPALNPNASTKDIENFHFNFDYEGVVIVADSEKEASALYDQSLDARNIAKPQYRDIDKIIHPNAGSTKLSLLFGLFGHSPLYNYMLINSFQKNLNEEITSLDSRTQLGLSNGFITKNELVVWAKESESQKDFNQKIAPLFLAIIPTIYEKYQNHIASRIETDYIKSLSNLIRYNKKLAINEAIKEFNAWIKNDRIEKEELARKKGIKNPILPYFQIGGTRIPDKFLNDAQIGIPKELKSNEQAAIIASSLSFIAILGSSTAMVINVSSLFPYSAPLLSVMTTGIGIVTGGVIAGMSVFAAIFTSVLEKIIHDEKYGSSLNKLYDETEKEVNFKELLKKENGIKILMIHILDQQRYPSPSLNLDPSINTGLNLIDSISRVKPIY